MATINRDTMDRMARVLFFVKHGANGLEQLPFELVTIDSDAQFYWPLPLTQNDSNGRRRRGVITGSVILEKNGALPRAPANLAPAAQDVYGRWEFHGR